MDLLEKIKKFIRETFNVNIETFLAAIKLSPNAQWYLSGAISELLLKEKLGNDYDILRIKEKWGGKKHPKHRGDFYIRKKGNQSWFVLESKGVKSNSEKWHKLYNYNNLKSFLLKNSEKIPWLKKDKSSEEEQIEYWTKKNTPKFFNEYKNNLYTFDEIKKYKFPSLETEKSKAISRLKNLTNEQIDELIRERLDYLMERIKVLETHFVSGTSGAGERTQATPRNDEFNLIAIDLYLRTGEHNFIFANPKELDPSESDPNHLKQNYIIGFIFPREQEDKRIFIDEKWYKTFKEAFKTLNEMNSANKEDMQIDYRSEVIEAETEKELKT